MLFIGRSPQIAMLIGLILSTGIYTATYYVAPNGSDANPSGPFKTIQKAADMAQLGDKVIIKAGTYYERVVMKKSGTSASRITFEGERGPNGEWLTIIHGTDAIPANAWVQAPEAGTGVWKTDAISYEAFSISEGEGFLWKIYKTFMDGKAEPFFYGKTGFQVLAIPAAWEYSSSYFYVPAVKFWDGIEAVFGDASNGTTYIRYRNGDNPNLKTLRSCPQAAVITIQDASSITVRNLEIKGGYYGIRITGASTASSGQNIIEDNHITGGSIRVYLQKGFSNTVRGNAMELKMIGTEKFGPKAWIYDPANPYTGSVTTHLYFFSKFVIGNSGSNFAAVTFGMGTGNRVHDNYLLFNERAIVFEGGDSSTHIDSNTMRWSLTANMHIGEMTVDLHVHDNLIAEGGQYNVRCDPPATGPHYFYRNRFFQRYDKRHQWTGGDNTWIYHNSISGGFEALGHGGNRPNTRILNNVCSVQRIVDSPCTVSVFDYNWGIGGGIAGGASNIDGATMIWPADSNLPNFALPLTHRARNAGLDLSGSFTVQGKTYPALPGMAPGYFGSQWKPDMGAVQGVITSIQRDNPLSMSSHNQPAFRMVPAFGGTNLVYFSRGPGNLQIDLCDVAGRIVRRIAKEQRPAGEQRIFFDGKDSHGSALAAGNYFIRLWDGRNVVTRWMAAIK